MADSKGKGILICAMGTLGDVAPFAALSVGLQQRDWNVVLAAPGEYKSFVQRFGIQYADIGRSLQQEMLETAEGRALRTAKPHQVLSASRAFFNVGLFESWFKAIQGHCERLRPDVLLLTSFTQMSGAAVIPRLLGLPRTRVMVAHCIPMRATGEFAVPLSGRGFSAPWPLLNRMQWAASAALVGRGIHAHTARRVVQRAVEELEVKYQRLLPGPALEIGPQFGLAYAPNLYIYSPTLLPKPADWPANCHVVGPLLLPHHQAQAPAAKPGPAGPAAASIAALSTGAGNPEQPMAEASERSDSEGSPREPDSPLLLGCPVSQESSDFTIPAALPEGTALLASSSDSGDSGSRGRPSAPSDNTAKAGMKEALAPAPPEAAAPGLPAALQAFLDGAFRQQQPVVYIGLGSMLGTVFEAEQVTHLLDSIAEGCCQLAARLPLRAVIHTALGGGRSGRLSKGVPKGAPFMLLDEPVPHNLLLPQCSLVVHHGGAGTTHATLAAGKPALVVPCVPASDQAFWGDLVWRRGLGPQWFHVRQLTPARLAAGLEEGLLRLDELTRNAEEMAVALHQEDGVAAAIRVIEAALQAEAGTGAAMGL